LSAKARLRTSISSLSEANLQKAVRWALGQTWVEGEPRNLLIRLYADLHPGTTTAQRQHK